jgi:Leucine-rich repeat (LRR) protein
MLSKKGSLTTLGLEFNSIGFEGAVKLLNVLKNLKNLEKLYLNHNDIKKEAGDALM